MLPMRISLIILLLNALWGTTSSYATDSGLLYYNLNDKISTFKLPEIGSNEDITFNPSCGKPSVLMFFSIKPSFRSHRAIHLSSELAKLRNSFNGRINIFSIYSGKNIPRLKQYIQDGRVATPILNDSNKTIYTKLGVFMLPLVIISDAKGRLQSVIPYTNNITNIIASNLKLLLKDWTLKQFKDSLLTPVNRTKTKTEKAYTRRVNYGRVLLARRMYSAALREFHTATKIMPNAIEAIIGTGQVQSKLKKLNMAIETFRRALKINKESDKALAGFALALYKSGNKEEALPILENALISEDQNLDVVLSLADIYEKNGNIPKAIRLNKLAISILLHKFKE